MNETWVTIVGNVASDVTMRRTASGEVVNFRVASSERRFDAASGEWQDGARFAARVSCWRRLATNVHRSVLRGDPVIINGRLSVREYEVDGQRRYSTEIEARSVGLDLSRVLAKVATDDGDTRAAVTDVSNLVELPEVAPAFDPEDDRAVARPSVVRGSADGDDPSVAPPDDDSDDDAEDHPFERTALAG